MKIVLTIAGSDSGAGAGLQADLKTFHAHGVYGLSVVTAITAQNTREVAAVQVLPAKMVEAQLRAVFDDFNIAAVKIGMVGSEANVAAIARFLKDKKIPVVLDPVMVAGSGGELMEAEMLDAFCNELIPLATLLTPNVYEAQRLTGKLIHYENDYQEAIDVLRQKFPNANVLLKGGHVPLVNPVNGEAQSVDYLLANGNLTTLAYPYLPNRKTHGTGCTLASAIAVHLARDYELLQAVSIARWYVHTAIENLSEQIGSERHPLSHFSFLT